MDPVTIGRKFAALRLRSGHTQESLAASISTSREHIARFETGAASVSLQVAHAALAAMGSSLEELFTEIPAKLSNEHQELHWKLQMLMDEGGEYEIGARRAVIGMFRNWEHETRESKSKKAPTGTEGNRL